MPPCCRSPTESRLAFTTDGFVVTPAFFPGSNIGELAVNGTVNDLAMMGAVPLALSAALILEEGLAMDRLGAVVTSMADACVRAGVRLVTGDTKVVERGAADGLYITTSGVGLIPDGVDVGPERARPGDRDPGDRSDRVARRRGDVAQGRDRVRDGRRLRFGAAHVARAARCSPRETSAACATPRAGAWRAS